MGSTILLFSAMAPFFAWTVELLLPYPAIIEELVKTVLVFFILNLPGNITRLKFCLVSGVLFAVSETIFYFFDIYLAGDLHALFVRLISTTLLHTLTFVVILLPSIKNKRFLPLGTALAILLHYTYNRFAGNL